MNFLTIVFASLCLAAAGCGDKSAKETPVKVETYQAQQVTAEDWTKAVESAYIKSSIKDEGDGVENFFACFQPTPDQKRKCTNFAFGKRDAFRKLRFYTSGITVMFGNKVSAYVSLSDNEKPVLFLAPHIFSGNSWLFINRLAIMVDGEVVLEKDLSDLKAHREVFPGGVEERVDFIATSEQIEALRKIKPESKFLVRITGEKGYITVDKTDLSQTKETLINAIGVYDALEAAVKNKIPMVQSEIKP